MPVDQMLTAFAEGVFSANRRQPVVMDRDGECVRLSPRQIAAIQKCHGDVEELFDRAVVAKQKLEARGKRMGSVARYMVAMAEEDLKRANGVEIGIVKELVSGNRHQQQAARADMAQTWMNTLDGKTSGPTAQRGGTPNGSALMAALRNGRAA